jgi:fumarate hydratase class I
MTVIRQQDVTQSIADALQYISYYHPVDFIQAVKSAYDREESKSAKDAMAQILINSRLCATGKRPICQDTGIVTIFVKVGMQVQWDAQDSLTDMINEGVRQAYLNPDNILRASILSDPDGGEKIPVIIPRQLFITRLSLGIKLKLMWRQKAAALRLSQNLPC